MLYYAYEAQRGALAPLRLFAETVHSLINQPWPIIGNLPLMRGTAAALNLFSRSGLSHERAPFGIDNVTIDGAAIPITEEIVSTHPFCRLVHFRKAVQVEQPKLLMVAPLSGHFATLLRGTIDPAANPTEVNRFAEAHSLSWFENTVITTVPAPYLGSCRRVYPGFLQLAGFLGMNFDRHVTAHWRMFQQLVEGDDDNAAATRAFYDEYSTVMDLPAEFYLETLERVFQRHDLAHGAFKVHGEPVDPGAIEQTALMTVEGERDDICGPGQTAAAQHLCRNLPDKKKLHHLQPGVGHYGVFNGRRWQTETYPRVRDFIRAHS